MFFLFLLLLLTSSHAIDVVIPLTSSNFDSFIKSNKYVLVEFYAPWCGFCKNFAPIYNDVATILSSEVNVRVAKVDSTRESSLAEKYEIKGYPTLLWFVNGDAFNRDSLYIPQSKDELVKFVRKMAKERVTVLETKQDVEQFIHNVIHASGKYRGFTRYFVSPMIGYFSSHESRYAEAFKKACESMEINLDVLCAMKISPTQTGRPIVTLHRVQHPFSIGAMFDRIGKITVEENYEGALVASDLLQWSHVHSLPSILKFSEKTQNKIYQSGITRQILLFIEPEDPNRDAILFEASTFAERHRGDILVIDVPTSQTRVLDFFNLDEFPAVRLVDSSSKRGGGSVRKYIFESHEITDYELENFVIQVRSGGKGFETRSRDLYTYDNNEEDKQVKRSSSVVDVVGSNFDTIVLDNSKDVVLMLYAPWNSNSQQLRPLWRNLAFKYSQNDNIVVAQMDASENEHESISFITKYPTVAIWRKGYGDEPVTYSGGFAALDSVHTWVLNNIGSVAAAAAAAAARGEL